MRSLFMLLMVLSFETMGQTESFEGKKRINGTNLFLSIHGNGDYLLVVHGGPGLNHSYFLPHLNGLEKDFRVVYYDQRACGQSAVPSVDSISMKFFIEDIEAIRKMLKVEKLNILAHSWGAVLAARYSIQYPDHVKKMVFSNPALLSHEYDAQVAALIKQKTTKQDSTDRARIMASEDTKKYEKLFLLSFQLSAYDKSNIFKINLNLPSNFIEGNTALFTGLSRDSSLEANLYESLKSFSFPLMIIQGSSDILPPAVLDRFEKEVPHAKRYIFKKSGHFPFVEEPDLFRKTLIRFLK